VKRFVGASVLLAGIVMMLTTIAGAESDMSRINRERTLVGRELLEMQSDNWPSLLRYYADDIEYHDPMVSVNGIGMMSEFLARLFTSSPDLVTTIEDEICINDIYAATWTMVGSFNTVPYNAKGITIIKFREKSTDVYYQRDYYTEGDIMATIPGLDEAIGGFRTYYRCAVDPSFDCPLLNAMSDDALSGDTAAPEGSLLPDTPMLGMGSPRSDMSRINRERKSIGRELVEIQAANWPSLLQFYADDIEYYDPIVSIQGIDMMAQFFARLFASGPDLITTVEDEICIDGIYAATWTMAGSFNSLPYSAKGMSIVKFRPGETQAYYARDYYTEGDIMINIPLLDEPTLAFRTYYRCAVDPTFECPFGLATGDALNQGRLNGSKESSSPAGFELRQNLPNPFNATTTISFNVPGEGGEVSLRVYDASGRVVKTLIDGYQPSGSRNVSWDGNNDQGKALASGIYFYRLTGPEFSESKKMFLYR
jgi:hypothetical protein